MLFVILSLSRNHLLVTCMSWLLLNLAALAAPLRNGNVHLFVCMFVCRYQGCHRCFFPCEIYASVGAYSILMHVMHKCVTLHVFNIWCSLVPDLSHREVSDKSSDLIQFDPSWNCRRGPVCWSVNGIEADRPHLLRLQPVSESLTATRAFVSVLWSCPRQFSTALTRSSLPQASYQFL